MLAGTCTGGSNQRWHTGTTGRLTSGGYCLDIPNASTANRTPLQLYSCNGSNAQRFSIKGPIVGQQSGKCLGLPVTSSGIVTFNNTEPQLATCSGGAHQEWEFRW